MTPSSKAAPAGKSAGAAARSERNGKGHKVTFHGLDLKLPAKLPFRLMRHLGAAEPGAREVTAVLEDILGAEQMESVWGLDIDMEQGSDLLEKILEPYGVGLGESAASKDS